MKESQHIINDNREIIHNVRWIATHNQIEHRKIEIRSGKNKTKKNESLTTTEKARTVVAGNDSERGGSGWLGFAIEAIRDLRFVSYCF